MGMMHPVFADLRSDELYRREAVRLRGLAGGVTCWEVRDELLRIAREYEVLASHNRALTRRFAGDALLETAEASA
ncbi:MAG TPA: hypothetical protein VGB82_23675 [Alphaproteobacteria bacterium]